MRLDPQSSCEKMPHPVRHDSLFFNPMSHCGLDPQSPCEQLPYPVRHDSLFFNPMSHCGLDPQSPCEQLPYPVRHDSLCFNPLVIAGLTRNPLASRYRIQCCMTRYVLIHWSLRALTRSLLASRCRIQYGMPLLSNEMTIIRPIKIARTHRAIFQPSINV